MDFNVSYWFASWLKNPNFSFGAIGKGDFSEIKQIVIQGLMSVWIINNEIENENFSKIYSNILKEERPKVEMFGYRNTVGREESIIKMEY